MSRSGARSGEPPPVEAVVWNKEEGRFETADKVAYLQYHLSDVALAPLAGAGAGEGRDAPGKEEKKLIMDMVHTYVPRSKRGMGIAARLCDAAFAHARRESMLVLPTCSYVSDTYLARNPEWRSIVYNAGEPRSSM